MTALQEAFAEARRTGSILPVFEPFIEAKFFIIGVLDGNGRPNIALGKSPREGHFCATVSEERKALRDTPDSRILPISGKMLLELIGDHDILIVYPSGGDVLQSEYVQAFREALA